MIQEHAKLHVGDALVWSPQWLRLAEQVHISKRETYDASSTPTSKVKSIKPNTLAPADLAQLGEQIAATIEKAKADDPRELRKQRAEANRMLVNQSKTIGELQARTPTGKEKRIEVPVLKDGQIARLEKVLDRFESLTTTLADARTEVLDAIRKAQATVQPTSLPGGGLLHGAPRPAGAAAARAATPTSRLHAVAADRVDAPRGRHEPAPADTNGYLPPGEKATLIAAAQYADGVTREQASILTGYKRSSRDAYIQRLLGKGYVELRSGNVVATDAGVAALGSDYEPLPTGEALQAYWLQRLPPGEKAVLEVLIGAPRRGRPPVHRRGHRRTSAAAAMRISSA